MFWDYKCSIYTKALPDFTPQILFTKTISQLDAVNDNARVTIAVEGNFFRNKLTRIIIDGSFNIPDQNVYFVDTNHISFLLPLELRYADIDYFQVETTYTIENKSGKEEIIARSAKFYL